MLLTQFIRDRTDVELERLARGAKWDSWRSWRDEGNSYSEEPGCLLCNAFDLRGEFDYMKSVEQHREVEHFYMIQADRNGQQATGEMIARLARREMGRRAMEALPALSPAENTSETVTA